MGLDVRGELLVAGLDLQLVRLLRDAIRVADVASGKGMAVAGIGPAPNPGRGADGYVVEPEVRFEPRPVVHPTPRFMPRPVICPEPRACPPGVMPPVEGEKSRVEPSPIEPVWKTLPPIEPETFNVNAHRPVKMVVRRDDLVSGKGSVLDVFI